MSPIVAFIEWLNGFPVVGEAIVTAIGTVIAAVLAVLSGVWTYALNRRRELRQVEAQRLLEHRRAKEQQRIDLDRQDRAREERISDIVRALHAEILTGIVLYEDQMDPVEVRHTIFDPTPFATPDETEFVFQSVVADLSILPSEVIHTVVAYYRVAHQTNLMIRDFREERFYTQPPDAKQRFLEGYLQLVWVLKDRGEEALAVLADHAKQKGIDLSVAERNIREATRKSLAKAGAAIRAARALGPDRSDDRTDGTLHDTSSSSCTGAATPIAKDI